MSIVFNGDLAGTDNVYSAVFKSQGAQISLWAHAGNYNGATLTFEASADGGTTWIGLRNMVDGNVISITSDSMATYQAPPQGIHIRAKFTKSGAVSITGSYVIATGLTPISS